MSKQEMYRLHKWIAVSVGGFFLVWLVSGIVMAIPTWWWNRLVEHVNARGRIPSTQGVSSETQSMVDFRDIQRSVPEAISVLEAHLGRQARVTEVKLVPFRNGIAYEITVKEGGRHLVDAFSGLPIIITEALASEMAREAIPHAGPMVNTVLLNERDFYYWGPLPVYKITFEGRWNPVVYVSASTGETHKWTLPRRLHRWVTSFHGFEPLALISDSHNLRLGLLLLLAMVGIGTVCTGFCLALPARLRPSRTIRQDKVIDQRMQDHSKAPAINRSS